MRRREFIQGAGVALAASSLAACSSTMKIAPLPQKKRLYIDGLSFVPTDHVDVKASGIDAYIADISAIEEVKRPDGS
jgi:membrane dipeptidase